MFYELLERAEAGGVGGSNARLATLYQLVGGGEFTQLVTNHLGLDFHLAEGLAIVHARHAAHHL